MADSLLSKGVPTDNTTIQLIETVGVVAVGLGVTGFMVDKTMSIVAIIAGLALLVISLVVRWQRGKRNEELFEKTLFAIPKSRATTITLELPKDVSDTVANLYGKTLTRLDLSNQLRDALGESRSSLFLPAVLSYADEVKPAHA